MYSLLAQVSRMAQRTLYLTPLSIALAFFPLCAPAHSQHVETWDEAPHPPAKKRIGDTTTAILEAQADGRIAGAALPMLGPTATLSWQRYLDSYKHPIPETFARKLDEIKPR